MRFKTLRLPLNSIICAFLCSLPLQAKEKKTEIRFTSVPDIFNWNISNPQPGWEDTLDWFFKLLKKRRLGF
ncbi:MAG: hypothetical protein P8M08_15205 [Akkermansiaceae bacterium]|nr:hypothetical protein [Akkermansiaceae bacterium]